VLKEEYTQRIFKSGVLGKIFGHWREELTKAWIKVAH
jgi:hypothetical protein